MIVYIQYTENFEEVDEKIICLQHSFFLKTKNIDFNKIDVFMLYKIKLQNRRKDGEKLLQGLFLCVILKHNKVNNKSALYNSIIYL